MGAADAERLYREVMTVAPSTDATPFATATRDFLFGGVWSRPGLSRRDRRLLTLSCVAAADSPGPIDAHVYAALNSGDVELEAMFELVLQFAVYCGWPKASHLEGVIGAQWARIHEERGEAVPAFPMLDNETLGPNDWATRLERGAAGVPRRQPRAGPAAGLALPPRRHPELRVRSRVAAPGSHAATSAASSRWRVSRSTTPPFRCGATSPRHCTRATSPRRRWTRSCFTSLPTTASPRPRR